MTDLLNSPLTQLTAQYLSLEELSVTEELLNLCGAKIDPRALPLLRRRLCEEEAQATALKVRGYVRMSEKCEQLVICLKQLIEVLEENGLDTTNTILEA